MSEPFRVALTRDFLDASGGLAYGDIGLGLLDQAPNVRHAFLPEYADTVQPGQIADADGLVLIYPWVKAETFAGGAGRLAVIARCGVGYDRIDLAACTAADVAVVNAPNALRGPTAAGALLMMLALAKQLLPLDRLVRAGRWDQRGALASGELTGRTLGIVGLGNTGRELVRLAAPFGMTVLAFSPHADPAEAAGLGVDLTGLDDLLRRSDFVCLHCRLTPETTGLIGAPQLALMKPSAFLINMARGPVVDHAALVEALRARRIAGAGLDVFHAEPLPADDPITALDNVVLSPHWLAGTRDVFREAGAANCRAMLAAARGLVPPDVVNHEVLARPGFQSKLARFSAP